MIASAAMADRQLKSGGSGGNGNFDEWRRGGDSNPIRNNPACKIQIPRCHGG
jgi:hypothetical protein